ncbi:MAG: glycosyl transferase group 1 [Verrucomicrobia bacterium]|nr:glycosyl transferase group 1 [Verrucomicrobiota bacterium]
MKILIVQDYLRSGGTERQSVLLANAMAHAGHATTLLTFRPGGALAGTVEKNVDLRAVQPFDVGLDWFAPDLVRTARRLKPDIVLCMGRIANSRAGALQHALPATAVIATMRTGKPLPALFRRSLQRVRHVVANSREARRNLVEQHDVSADKISVIHNSLVFPPDLSAVRNDALRQAQGATAATVVLLCVAMFRPEKNQRELVEIAAALPREADWQLWLAGDGPSRAACEYLVADHDLGARVKFLGFHRDPSPLYRAADIAVHASTSESLSNFLIEAQAAGLPAVVYDAQGIGECFIPDKTGWIVPQGDRAGFLARLAPLLADPALRQACAAPAREYARRNFDAARQFQAYLDLFARLAQPASKP